MNKTIWLLWLQGWDHAPEIADYCLQSWIKNNPEWKVVVLDRKNYSDWCDLDERLPSKNPNNIALSDLVRASLLANHGGVWVDTTLWCNKPLDKWLEVKDSFFFTRGDPMFHMPSRPRVMENFFLAAQPNSYIFSQLYATLIAWWKWRIRETDQFEHIYAPFNMCLGELFNKDRKARDILSTWTQIDVSHDNHGKHWGRGPHLLTPYHRSFNEPLSVDMKRRIDSKIDHLYKLTYKEGTSWRNPKQRGIHPDKEKIPLRVKKGSPIHYLLSHSSLL